MKQLIKQLREFKHKNLSEGDIWQIKELVYEFMNTHDYDYWRLDYILDEIKNKSEIEYLISERVLHDGLYTLERLKNVDLEAEYYQLDGYDNIMNLEEWDIENRLDQIIDQLGEIKDEIYNFYDLAYNQ